MLRRPRRGHRMLAAIFVLSLSAMLLLTSEASPPVVSIQEVHLLDEGSVVVVLGVLVDAFRHDVGAESLVLADLSDGSTLRVYCSQGLAKACGSDISIGDEVRARGELASPAASPIVFASDGGIVITKDSASVLTVAALSAHWALFEGDEFSICGLVVQGQVPGSLRLADPDLKHSIALVSEDPALGNLIGKRVALTAALRLQTESMCLELVASSVRAGVL